MNKIYEKTIENKLAKYYIVNNYLVKKQVSLSSKRIDLVVIAPGNDEITAIEIKLYDWKTALRQANLNKIACHKSYVAIWHEFSQRAVKERKHFERLGIGLIIVSSSFVPKIEINPKNYEFVSPLACKYILSQYG